MISILILTTLVGLGLVYFLYVNRAQAGASDAAGPGAPGHPRLAFRPLLLVALIASCASSLLIAAAETSLVQDPRNGYSAVLGFALLATMVSFPVTLIALPVFMVPATRALNRRIGPGWARDLLLIAFGLGLGPLILLPLRLDLSLRSEPFLGLVYGGGAGIVWVIALHTLRSLNLGATPSHG